MFVRTEHQFGLKHGLPVRADRLLVHRDRGNSEMMFILRKGQSTKRV